MHDLDYVLFQRRLNLYDPLYNNVSDIKLIHEFDSGSLLRFYTITMRREAYYLPYKISDPANYC